MIRKIIIFAFISLVFLVTCNSNDNHIKEISDFSLIDLNPNSPTFNKQIGPSYFKGNITGYYFGDAGWGLCRSRFGSLDKLYNELLKDGLNINFIGINGISTKDRDYNEMISGRSLPWVQDNEDSRVWESWDVLIRDLILLDKSGHYFDLFNLTDFDISKDSNYQLLKEKLINNSK